METVQANRAQNSDELLSWDKLQTKGLSDPEI